MLTKILFTLAVMVIVGLVFRNKRVPTGTARPQPAAETASESESSGLKPQTIAYIIVGFIMLASVFFYYLKYQDDHQIMEIRITNPGDGNVVVYEAYRDDIDGKTFTTLDGRKVTIGDAERFEVLTR